MGQILHGSATTTEALGEDWMTISRIVARVQDALSAVVSAWRERLEPGGGRLAVRPGHGHAPSAPEVTLPATEEPIKAARG